MAQGVPWPDLVIADLIATVEATGCTARRPQPDSAQGAAGSSRQTGDGDEPRPLRQRQRLITAVPLAVPVIVPAMVPAGQFEARSERRAGATLKALLEPGAKDVTVLRGGREEQIPVGELRAGDRLLVRPSEKIATDRLGVEGSSAVDAFMLTGESVPVGVGAGRRGDRGGPRSPRPTWEWPWAPAPTQPSKPAPSPW
ncbi:putative protein OS=Streptomyces fumanus OX=67302 GN=GCM10018772_61970 PE=4 SV=1 [Streptomyces fumanus]|uniref:P-type ATPase A domain-containing protein n=1 Tax=Streptomyces fumanus TaxID=67302 RepID=A0A919AXC3_9ACTN|nr:hypothetical protein GCM10018772_61970 [Streptomyces fumanus]